MYMKLKTYVYCDINILYHYFKNSPHYEVMTTNKKITHSAYCNYLIVYVK